MDKTTQLENKPEWKALCKLSKSTIAAGYLTLMVAIIFLGFALDGITEYGHHACFILAGLMIGVGIGKMK